MDAHEAMALSEAGTSSWVQADQVVAVLAAEVRRLVKQRNEALRWHTQDARMGHDDVRCASCQEESWPCPTVRALEGA